MINGLCLIPEGRKKIKSQQDMKSEIYNVSSIIDLKNYLSYAEEHNLGVLYISFQYGVSYADDIVTKSRKSLFQLSRVQLKIWSKIIAEQVLRECLLHLVSEVHLMVKHETQYKFLIQEIQYRGVKVFTPLLQSKDNEL